MAVHRGWWHALSGERCHHLTRAAVVGYAGGAFLGGAVGSASSSCGLTKDL